MDKITNPLASKTVWAGILTAVCGYLQVAYHASIDIDTQQRLINIVFGLATILGGKGAVLFRLMVAAPQVKELLDEVKKLRFQIGVGNAPSGGVVNPDGGAR